MRNKVLSILILIGILVVLTIPFATPVMATYLGGAKDVGIDTLGGEKLHPANIYLRGMTIHYKPLMFINIKTGDELTWTGNITDTTPDGVSHELNNPATPVVLHNGESWSYTNAGTHDFYNYVLSLTGTELADVASPPAPTTHSVQNILHAVGYQPYPDVANDTESKTSYVATPSIQVLKTPDKTLVKPGDVVTYNLTVKNDGDWNMTMQSVTDDKLTIPAGSFGNLAVGASQSVFVTYTVPDPAPNPLVNHFTATYNATGFDASLTGATVSHQATASVPTINPKYTLTKSANPTTGLVGTVITYTVVITNTGDRQLDLTSASDSLVSPIPAFPATLAASGGNATITYTRAIQTSDKPGPINNKITTIYRVDGLTNNLTRDASAQVTITPDVPHTQLTLPIGVSPPQVSSSPPGTDVTITVTDTNTGNVDLLSPEMRLWVDPPNSYPLGTYVLMTLISGDGSPGFPLIPDGIMQPGEIFVFNYTVPGLTAATSFIVEGHGVVNGQDFTEPSEKSSGSVSPLKTPPASSSLTLAIMIVGFAGVITFFTLRSRRRSHQRS